MIRHHPSADVIAAYASGALDEGAALVVACHIDACATCSKSLSLWSSVGGTLLEQTAPLALGEGALDRALRTIAAPQQKAQAPKAPAFLARFDLPDRLLRQDIGPRQWLTPGIWFAPINTQRRTQSRTYVVYGRRNTALPRHTHVNREFTAVMSGGYRDTLGDFDAGDFIETDPSVLHAPGVTNDAECLCLISSDGPMKLEGFIARLVQLYAGRRY